MNNLYIEKLEYLANSFDKWVCKIALKLIHDKKFQIWSGSSKKEQHHYGDYGLIKHTAEVVELVLSNNELLNLNIDESELFLSALYHDSGKTHDYEKVNGVWGQTIHKTLIHHISRSALIWHDAVINSEINDKYHDNILHNILSHHGQREWGSPISPKTKVAWLLHLCDGISARMDDGETLDLTRINV